MSHLLAMGVEISRRRRRRLRPRSHVVVVEMCMKMAGDDEPNPNFFDLSFLGEMFRGSWDDLSDALDAAKKEGKEFEEGWISLFLRLYGLTFPGMAFHSPRDYLNAARLSKVALKDDADLL